MPSSDAKGAMVGSTVVVATVVEVFATDAARKSCKLNIGAR